jgi:hypothetical protein
MLTAKEFHSDYAPGTELQAEKVTTAKLVAFFSDITCGEGCWKAKEDICRCSCGGKNHGINLRGGNANRTAKIGGHRYELMAVGLHGDLMDQGATLTAEHWLASGQLSTGYERRPYKRDDLFWTNNGVEKVKAWVGMHNLKGAGSLYCVKYASLPQCLKWPELSYFQVATDRDRYHSNAAILWKRCED